MQQKKLIGKYLENLQEEGGCLVHFVRLATTMLKSRRKCRHKTTFSL